MYWIALQSTLPVVVQFSLGGVPGLVALLTAAVPGWLAMRARLARQPSAAQAKRRFIGSRSGSKTSDPRKHIPY